MDKQDEIRKGVGREEEGEEGGDSSLYKCYRRKKSGQHSGWNFRLSSLESLQVLARTINSFDLF